MAFLFSPFISTKRGSKKPEPLDVLIANDPNTPQKKKPHTTPSKSSTPVRSPASPYVAPQPPAASSSPKKADAKVAADVAATVENGPGFFRRNAGKLALGVGLTALGAATLYYTNGLTTVPNIGGALSSATGWFGNSTAAAAAAVPAGAPIIPTSTVPVGTIPPTSGQQLYLPSGNEVPVVTVPVANSTPYSPSFGVQSPAVSVSPAYATPPASINGTSFINPSAPNLSSFGTPNPISPVPAAGGFLSRQLDYIGANPISSALYAAGTAGSIGYIASELANPASCTANNYAAQIADMRRRTEQDAEKAVDRVSGSKHQAALVDSIRKRTVTFDKHATMAETALQQYAAHPTRANELTVRHHIDEAQHADASIRHVTKKPRRGGTPHPRKGTRGTTPRRTPTPRSTRTRKSPPRSGSPTRKSGGSGASPTRRSSPRRHSPSRRH